MISYDAKTSRRGPPHARRATEESCSAFPAAQQRRVCVAGDPGVLLDLLQAEPLLGVLDQQLRATGGGGVAQSVLS